MTYFQIQDETGDVITEGSRHEVIKSAHKWFEDNTEDQEIKILEIDGDGDVVDEDYLTIYGNTERPYAFGYTKAMLGVK